MEASVDFTETQHVELSKNLVLTQATSILELSKFELRLLRFFDEKCANLFSHGVDEKVHKVMKEKVPYLFLQSELVRKSIFCLSAMAMSSIVDLEMVQKTDIFEDERSLERIYNTNKSDHNSLYSKNLEYFLDVISNTRKLIEVGSEITPTGMNLNDPSIAKEMAISSILIFCYMGITPHKIVPIIDFSKRTPDLIQIAKGMRSAFQICMPIILESELSPLLGHQPIPTPQTPTLKLCTYPMIVELKLGLEEYYNSDEISLEISNEILGLEDTLRLLILCIYTCSTLTLPLPMYRFLFLLPDHFRDLLYKKHKFALRILFIYSALCAMVKCDFDAHTNVYRDFMLWYSKEGYMVHDMDNRLYDAIFFKNYGCISYYEFDNLDPYNL